MHRRAKLEGNLAEGNREAARQRVRDLDFNVLGIWFRVFFDIGIREQDHRGMIKANGVG